MRKTRKVTIPGGYLDRLRLQSIEAASRGNVPRAMDLAKRYHARRPNDVGVLNRLACMHIDQGDWAGFLKYGRRSYNLEPKNKHLDILVKAYFKLGRYQQGLEFCREELKRRSLLKWCLEPRVLIRLCRAIVRAKRSLLAQEKLERERLEAEREEQLATAAVPTVEAPPARPEPTPSQIKVEAPAWPDGSPPEVCITCEVDTSDLARELACEDSPSHSEQMRTLTPTDVYLKHEGLAERFLSEFQTLNVTVDFKGSHDGFADYLGVGIYFEADTPDQDDGVLEAWINIETGVVVEFPPDALLRLEPRGSEDVSPARPMTSEEIVQLAATAVRKASPWVEDRLHHALEQVQHRVNSEYAEIQEQFAADWDSLVASPVPDSADRDEVLPIALAERIHRRDAAARRMAEEHHVKVKLQSAELRRIRLPVMLCTLKVTRKQASHRFTVTWNPLTKRFDPVSCSRCRMDAYAIGASNSGELLCGRCVKHR